MGKTPFDKKIISNSLSKKLNITFKGKNELRGWYYLDGKKTIRYRIPKGRGTISYAFQREIENSTRLNNDDFEALIRCPMTGPKYDNRMRRLRDRNLL